MILGIGLFNMSFCSFIRAAYNQSHSVFPSKTGILRTPETTTDTLEPRMLGWSWACSLSTFKLQKTKCSPQPLPDHPAHLRNPPSSKENTTRNIYSILHESIDCTLFPILCGIFCTYSHWWFEGFFCLVFWAECFVGVHPLTNVQLFRRSLTLQIGLKSQNVPPTLLKYLVGN